MVDVNEVWRNQWQLMPAERGKATGDDRPCLLVASGLAGEVPTIEFRYGRVEVVEIECNPCS